MPAVERLPFQAHSLHRLPAQPSAPPGRSSSSRSRPPPPLHTPYLHAVVAFPRVRHQQHNLPFGRPFTLLLRIPFIRGSLQSLALLPVLLRSLAGPARPLRHGDQLLHGRRRLRVRAAAGRRSSGADPPPSLLRAPHARSAVGTLRSQRAAPSAAPASAQPRRHLQSTARAAIRRPGGGGAAAAPCCCAPVPGRSCSAGRFVADDP